MELERTFDENVYSNVDDGSVFPLFVRYSEKNVDFNNKNNSTSFEDMVAQIKGVHECCFIHRRQKNRDGKLLDELAIKIDEISDYLATGVVGCAIGRDFYHNTTSFDEITKRAKKAVSLIK